MVPEARRLGIRPLPWVVLVICSGAIGLLAMLARILYLKGRTPATTRV
jgi:threonine dehydrogenase-like Zn-dependent dehydrogenase